jgi:hypothetical protein
VSETDDWAPVKSVESADDWTPVLKTDPMPDALQASVPEAFLDRVRAGQMLTRLSQAAIKEGKDGVGGGTPTGFSDETLNHLVDTGIFHDPVHNRASPVQIATEAVAIPAAQLWQTIGMSLSAGIHGAGGLFGQIVDEFGGRGEPGLFTSGSPDRAKSEMINAGNWAMIEAGFGRFARPAAVNGAVEDQAIGGLPGPKDFTNAGKVLESPHAEANLKQMWQQDGIHPAEAVHDAQNDAFLKHDLTAKQESVKVEPAEEELMGVKPGSLSAAATDDIPLVSPDVQPLSRAGTLVASGRKAIEDLQGLGSNIQFLLDPMATGSNRAMVIAKDTMNSVRRIRWDHARLDADIVKKFDPELRENMFNAADEESVARQTGDVASPNIGLNRLDADQRAYIENLHSNAQSAWLHAVDAGMVEGEGLPAYTPRMVMNVAAAGESLSPRALNELGRNVFTRTSQMLHRGNLEIHETEAAAKELVRSRMAERGASQAEIDIAVEKVKVARDIRALPLATAKLQEAAIWREMVNKIEETGKSTGEQVVSVGYKPASDWFTIAGNPAFTKWEPMFEKNGAVRMGNDGNPIMVPKPIYMSSEFKGPMTAILDESSGVSKVVPGANSLYGALMALKGKSMTAILNSPLIHNEVVWSKVMEAAGGREWLGFGLYFRGNRIVNNPGRAGELIERGLNPMGPRGAIQDITGMMEQPDVMSGYHKSFTGKLIGFVPGLFDEAAGVATEHAIAKAGNFVHNTLLWDRVRDVQFGLADHLSDRLVGKGVDRLTADRVATHFSNIIVGSIPKEAMSAAARATANMLLFSRSFTLGNLSTFKQAAMGMPKPILAQIERDFGISAAEAIPAEGAAEASKIASGIARRKAVSTIAMSAGLYYVGNALLQHGFNIASRDSSINEELQGYARRYKSLMDDVKGDPFELRHLVSRLSPTYDNEPSKQDRAFVANDPQGTGLYARNPTGKFGEEMVGYPTHPMKMLRQKLSPLAGGLLDILENDKGFGQKIYDENDTSIKGDWQTAMAVGKHLVMKHLPEGQIMGGLDLLRGDGDKRTNLLRLTGPALGFTVSRGYPGGPARGEVAAEKQEMDTRFNLAWPDIKKQIQRNDDQGATAAMEALKISPRQQISLKRSALDPASALKGRVLQNFLRTAKPEQLDRFDRARQVVRPPQ